MPPNIFTYATSELSQDAFICWLVACAFDDEDSLRKCGTEFIRRLWNHGRGTTSGNTCAITDVTEPQRQHGKSKIDVYFEARVDETLVGFAIEDKINSEMGDDQLPGQRVEIQSYGHLDDKRLIYYKTGYVFEDERKKANDAGFVVFDAQDMLKFLNGGSAQNVHEILRQYREHLATQVRDINDLFQNSDMTYASVQSKCMSMLRDRLVKSMDCWAGFLNETMRLPDDKHHVTRGQNMGTKGPWTQYWFSNHLFWRLDAYQPLRLMVSPPKTTEALGDRWNKDVWDRWIEAFSLAQEEIQLPAADFNKVMHKGGKPVNEGTVGAIDIKTALESDLEITLDKIVKLHSAFLQRIN